MNRERNLFGTNGYDRELRIDPLFTIRQRAATGPCRWLDLCCGSGRALIEAAQIVNQTGERELIRIEGIDLAGKFRPNPFPDVLMLREMSVEAWQPDARGCDLITCVHGLHYIGDKLGLIEKAVTSLTPAGVFVANFDAATVRLGTTAGTAEIRAMLKVQQLEYDGRRKLIRCAGRRNIRFPLDYCGADDAAGPNYTGQHAVNSYYSVINSVTLPPPPETTAPRASRPRSRRS